MHKLLAHAWGYRDQNRWWWFCLFVGRKRCQRQWMRLNPSKDPWAFAPQQVTNESA